MAGKITKLAFNLSVVPGANCSFSFVAPALLRSGGAKACAWQTPAAALYIFMGAAAFQTQQAADCQ